MVRRRTVEVMRAMCGLCAELGGAILVHGSPDQRALTIGDEVSGRSTAPSASRLWPTPRKPRM